MRIAGLVCALAVSASLAVVDAAQAGIRVLIAGSNAAYIADVRSKIQSTGLVNGTIDVFDINGGTPSVNMMKTYDVVVVHTDGGVNDSTALGNNLADFVDAGGGVVEATFDYWNAGIGVLGRWQTGNYKCMISGGQASPPGLTLGTRLIPSHPILAGVATFNGGTNSYHNTGVPSAGVNRIADWSNGQPLVMTREGVFNGKIASLNFYPPSRDVNGSFWVPATDGAKLLANAVNYCSQTHVDVLIAGGPLGAGWLDEVKNTLRANGRIGGVIDTFDINAGTPTLALMRQYDTVFVFTDGAPADANLLGNRLADYVDAGGGVVAGVFSHGVVAGRFASQGYNPFADTISYTSGVAQTLGTRHFPNHPMLENIGTFNGGTSSYRHTGGLRAGATRIADWSDGQPLLATRTGLAGKVAGLNFYPVSNISRADFWVANTDGAALISNAINHVARNDSDVLVLGDLNDGLGFFADAITKIRATGQITGQMDFFDHHNGTPSLARLRRYDSVLVAVDYVMADAALEGDIMSYFVDGGGGVVSMYATDDTGFGLTGRWAAGLYSPLAVNGSRSFVVASLGNVQLGRHPIMFNVAAMSSAYRQITGLTAGAVRIADYDDGSPLAAEKSINNGRVLALNYFPASSDVLPSAWTQDGGRLMANALNYVARSDADVLLTGGWSGTPTYLVDIHDKILATGRIRGRIDMIDITGGSATRGLIGAYDAVLIGTNFSFDGNAMGDVLADYNDAGGGVVTMPGAHAGGFSILGRWAAQGFGAFPANGPVNFLSGVTLGAVFDAGHPTLAGVRAFNTGTNSPSDAVAVTAGADRIANLNNGFPLVAEKKHSARQVVGLNFFPASSDVYATGWVPATDGDLLMANALVYVSTTRPCFADFNNDGFVDFFDAADFIDCFEGRGCPPGKTADYNRDGFVDFFDAADFTDAFEAGC